MEVCGIFDSNIRISPWKNATKSWQLCFPFVPPFSYSLSLSLSCLWLNIFETKYRQKLSHIWKKRSIVRKKRWGVVLMIQKVRWSFAKMCTRKKSSKARLVVYYASCAPNWNVTILWNTGTIEEHNIQYLLR